MYKKILALCLFIFCVTPTKTFEEEDIIIVTEEWAPFNYIERGELTGFSTEIVQSIIKAMGKDYRIILLPSMRTTYVLNTRPHTIMFSLFRTPEREDKYKWVGPLCDGSIYFYKRKDNNSKFETLEDLKKAKSIACRHAGLIPNLLVKNGFKNLDMTATDSLQVYKKVLAGRCDIAISDTDLGVKHCLRLLDADPDILEKTPVKMFESTLYIACSKDISNGEIRRWQNALNKLKSNGVYDRIYLKYNQ